MWLANSFLKTTLKTQFWVSFGFCSGEVVHGKPPFQPTAWSFFGVICKSFVEKTFLEETHIASIDGILG